MFDLPARVGYPVRLYGLTEEVYHPQFSTAVGMLLYAYKYGERSEGKEEREGILQKIKQGIKKFLKGG
jgi:cell division protein FtsA